MKGRRRGIGPFLRFMETKGFYLVLAVCVITVGAAGYVIFGRGTPAGNVVDREEVMQEEELEVDDPKLEEIPDEPTVKDPDSEPEKETQTKPEQPDTQVSKPVSVPKAVYAKPVTGKVIREFSGDTLVKDDTMGDWRTHNGTDFACAKDAKAVAFAAGTVTEVKEQGLYGLCVTVDHGSGLQSMLAGLATCKVKPGDRVTCGQEIGTCAGNLEAESAQESHVHLEVTKAGKYMDPMRLIGK